MSTPAEIAPILEDCFNRRDGDLLLSLWADDFSYEGPGNTFAGKGRMLQQEQNLWVAFPDICCEITPFIWGSDKVVFATRMRGTHQGPLRLGNGNIVAPTGRPVDFTLSVHLRFRHGRIAGERVFYDTAGLQRQLGLLSPMTR